MQRYLKRHKIKVTFMLGLGLILSLFLKASLKRGWKMFSSDMFFCISIIFLIYGLWSYILEVGFFNSFIYGAKSLKRIIYPESKKPSSDQGDYASFVQERSRKRDVLPPIFIGVFFLVISILVPIII